MIEITNRAGEVVKIFGDIVEDESIAQIKKLSECKPYLKSHIRVMPDVHAGKGCTIGTTMIITDAITPNLVGVDIGCGMYVVPLGDVDIDLADFDKVVNDKIPSGFHIHDKPKMMFFDLSAMHCRDAVDFDVAQRSIGTLGGGNHFIEIDVDDNGNKYLVIHSGSRSLGVRVCGYHQHIAEKSCGGNGVDVKRIISDMKACGRESEIQSALQKLKMTSANVDKDFAYLKGEDMNSYLYDMNVTQHYARLNRETIAALILSEFKGILGKTAEKPFHTTHNYIELATCPYPILRKGAVSAYMGQRLIIPMNMRDGSLICVGKGNIEWNYSAPHGSGRIMSRKKARESISVEEFETSMSSIYSTSVCAGTIDEAPQAYKPMDSIVSAIGDTVDVEKIIHPIYNFKAKE